MPASNDRYLPIEIQGGSFDVQIDEHQAVPNRELKLRQGMAVRVYCNDFVVRNSFQLPLFAECPGVIRTDDVLINAAQSVIQQPGTAVSADAGQSAKLTIIATHNCDRFTHEMQRKIVA